MLLYKKIKTGILSIFKGAFAKNILIVTGGTTLTQLISIIMSPILSRLYSPSDFGILSLYSAVLGMVVVTASLNYEWSIPIVENDSKATNIIVLSILILLLISSLIVILFISLGSETIGIVIGEDLIPYRYLLPVGVLLTGTYNILLKVGYRDKSFKIIAKTKLSQAITGNGIKGGLGLMGIGPLALIIGNILSTSAGSIKMGLELKKTGKYSLHDVNCNDMRWCAKRYKDFPIYFTPSQVLNTAGLNLPTVFLGFLYGVNVTGAYSFASGIISLPVQLIGNSVADVFYSEAASIGVSNPAKLKALSVKLFWRLLIIGLIPFIVLVIFGPVLFSFVFGTRWEVAGKYSQILATLTYARLVLTPFSRIFSVYEKQKLILFLDILRVILVMAVFLVCMIFNFNEYTAIFLYAITMCIVYVTTFILVQAMLKGASGKEVGR